MSVRLGVSPIGWSNDDLPELGGDTPLETCLAEAQQAGFAGIELGGKFPREAAVLRPLLARHRLALVSGWYGGHLLERSVADEIVAIEAHLRLLVQMGASVVVFAETSGSIAGERQRPISQRRRLSEADWPEFARRLTALAEHVAARGVALAYHHHMGTVIENEAETDRLMGMTGDAVGLVLDTGHLAYVGADPIALARRHHHRIKHVHCKDVRPDVLARVRADDASFLDAVLAGVFTVPGDGSIDFAGVAAMLADIGYDGWLVVEAEQDPELAPPLEYARMGFRHLGAVVAAAGLTLGEA
jgi:inosose dehydratase